MSKETLSQSIEAIMAEKKNEVVIEALRSQLTHDTTVREFVDLVAEADVDFVGEIKLSKLTPPRVRKTAAEVEVELETIVSAIEDMETSTPKGIADHIAESGLDIDIATVRSRLTKLVGLGQVVCENGYYSLPA